MQDFYVIYLSSHERFIYLLLTRPHESKSLPTLELKLQMKRIMEELWSRKKNILLNYEELNSQWEACQDYVRLS